MSVVGQADANHLSTPDFPAFDSLLQACREYAELTGYRFRARLFKVHSGEDVPAVGATDDKVEPCSAALRDAARQAAPVIAEYAQRLREGEELLLDSADRAHRLVMGEGVRNGMVATFREVGLWPPMPPPPGVEDDDCSYEDTSAPLPIVAQRAFNDEKRREKLVPFQQRLSSASFIVDFATELGGVSAPDLAELHSNMMQGLMARVDEWELSSRARPAEDLASKKPAVGLMAYFGGLTKSLLAQVVVAVLAVASGYAALRYSSRIQ